MTRIACESGSWPTVVVRFRGAYTDSDFGDYLGELSSLVERGPAALIVDTRSAQPPTAIQRQRLMHFVKTHWGLLTSMCGVVFVVDSPLARHALIAVSWVVTKPCAVEFAASMSEAQTWVTQHAPPIARSLRR
jgi:hypothetical protein